MEKEEKKNKKENKGLKHLEEENHKLKNDLKKCKMTKKEMKLKNQICLNMQMKI